MSPSLHEPAAPPASPAPPAASPPPRNDAKRRRLVVLAVALAVVQVCAFVESPPWRLDLWHRADAGYPRLLGAWSPAALLVLWLSGLPVILATWTRLLPRGRRDAALGWWIGWMASVAGLGVLEVAPRVDPSLMPERAIRFLAYRGWSEYPYGVRLFEDDPLLMLRHRPDHTMRTWVDYGRTGGLLVGGYVSPVAAAAPRDVYRAARRIGPRGLDAAFGSVSDGEEPARVAILGDSFVFGYCLPVEATWPSRLAERLGAAAAREEGRAAPDAAAARRGIATFACGNYTPHEGLMALALEAPVAYPETIVAVFYEGNDLGDAQRNGEARVAGDTPTGPYRRALFRQPPHPFELSRVHALLAALLAPTDLRLEGAARAAPWTSVRSLRAVESRALRADPTIARVPSVLREEGTWRRVLVEPVTPRWPDEEGAPGGGAAGSVGAPLAISPYELIECARPGAWFEGHAGWPHLMSGLNDLAHLRRTRGVRVVVVWAPTKLRVLLPFLSDEDLEPARFDHFVGEIAELGLLRDARREGSWRPLLAENADRFMLAMEREARRRGLEWLDLTPPLIDAARARREIPYFPWDTHWNLDGHEVAARAVAEHLLRGESARDVRPAARRPDGRGDAPAPTPDDDSNAAAPADAADRDEAPTEAPTEAPDETPRPPASGPLRPPPPAPSDGGS